MLIYVHS